MADCVSDCFWSTDTAWKVVGGVVIGAVIGAFLGCFIDGAIAFTDAGISCAVNIIADLWGFWLVGAVLGLILSAMLAYGQCQESCAAQAAAGDNTTQQGLGSDGSDEPHDCATAKHLHGLALASATKANEQSNSLLDGLKRAQGSLKHAQVLSFLVYVVAVLGALRKPWVLFASAAVLVPLASSYRSR